MTQALTKTTVDRSDLDTSGADTDRELVDLWLQGRSPHTARAYRRDVERFLAFVEAPLRMVSVAHVLGFADSLKGAMSSQSRTLSAIKSLLSFGHRTGYLPFNVGGALRLPKAKNTLAERILPEAETQRMIALEQSPRNAAIIRLLYGAGLRASELCGLIWRDLVRRDDAGQATIYGKGDKTRVVLLSAATWAAIAALKPDGAGGDVPVFVSRRGGPLHTSAVYRIVRAAADRAGIGEKVSPHWLRHGHASHALDRGAPIHVVQSTLGHASLATTSKYTHARPSDSSARYLAV